MFTFTLIVGLSVLALLAAVYLTVFRAEGLFAFYLLGTSLIFIVVNILGISWSTAMTGAVFPVLFVPCILWWMLARKDPLDPQVPRRFGLAVILILSLAVFWQIKHLFETQTLHARSAYEYYKWMYMIARWAAPFILGVMFPLTLVRFRRFLGASMVMAVIIALAVVVSYLLGRADFGSAYGARYSPAERLGPLGISIFSGVGASCVMGYILMKQRLGERMFFGGAGGWLMVVVLVFAILLSGSRGPFVAVIATLVVTLLLIGGRGAVRLAVGLGIASVAFMLAWAYLPEAALQRVFGEGMMLGKRGIGERWALFLGSFNILRQAPLLGQTLELARIIQVGPIDTTHQITTQVMVEMGLVGLTVFLIAVVPPVVKCFRAATRLAGDVSIFAAPLAVMLTFTLIQRHIAGALGAHDFWMIAGLVMGHTLRRADRPYPDEEQWHSIPDAAGQDPRFAPPVGGPL